MNYVNNQNHTPLPDADQQQAIRLTSNQAGGLDVSFTLPPRFLAVAVEFVTQLFDAAGLAPTVHQEIDDPEAFAERASPEPAVDALAEHRNQQKLMYRRLVRKAARHARKRSAVGEDRRAAIMEIAATYPDQLPASTWVDAVGRHNRRLNKRYRRLRARMALRLRNDEGWKVKDIAERLGISRVRCSNIIKEEREKLRIHP